MSLSPGARLGPYEVVAPVGVGGMGEVYRARDSRLGRDVAIKVLPSELSGEAGRLRRFEMEARAASALNHPSIVSIYDVGSEGSISYIVMELVVGRTLRELLLSGALASRKALQIGVQVAEGLAAAHAAGIVHRDLKPENVMVTKGGVAKILDFGLAKLTASIGSGEGSLPTISRTEPGGLLGTVSYMSPEQASGQPADSRSDQFSFGSIVYEMLTGRKAFHRETAVDTLAAILHEEPETLAKLEPETPLPLQWVVERCLAKDPTHRYDSTRDLARELANLRDRLSGESGVALAAGSRPHGATWRRLAPWAVALLGLLAAGMLAVVHFGQRSARPRTVRFTFPLPERIRSAGEGLVETSNLAVSPDGSQIAFVDVTEERSRIWVRPLRALTAQPIEGTEGAISPFWSPDGSHLAFFAGERLKRIPLSGGLAQTLCEVSGSLVQGAWGKTGSILFAQGGLSDRGLYQVSASGGTPRLISGEKSWQEYRGYRWPHFLPDGKRFLCLAWGGKEGGTGSLLAGQLGSAEVRRVAQLDSRAELAGSGHLFYVRDETLMARPFDVERLQFTGEALPAAVGVPHFYGSGWAPFSVSESGALAYQGGVTPTALHWTDRQGQSGGNAGPPGTYGQLRLSRDASKVAVQKFEPHPVLWIEELSRGVLTRFTSAGFYESSPVWSPDGNTLAFSVPGELWAKRADDTGPGELLLPPKADERSRFPLDWSLDGRFLLYSESDTATQLDLWILPLSGERKPFPFRQTDFNEGQGGAAFSPDGRWVAYLSDESGRDEVYVAPFQGSGQRILSTTGAMPQPPRWRGDGREVFYVAADRSLMSVDVRAGAAGLEFGAPVALFRVGSDFGNSFDAASDGQRFLINPGTNLESLPITVVLDWTSEARR